MRSLKAIPVRQVSGHERGHRLAGIEERRRHLVERESFRLQDLLQSLAVLRRGDDHDRLAGDQARAEKTGHVLQQEALILVELDDVIARGRIVQELGIRRLARIHHGRNVFGHDPSGKSCDILGVRPPEAMEPPQ
jgi:hypothetical protein